MYLLWVNIKDDFMFEKTVRLLNEAGFNGMVLPSTSIHNVMSHASVEPIPFFGGFNKLKKRPFDTGHTLIMLLEPERMELAKEKVREVVADMKHKGVMFAIPVEFCEGL